MRLVERHKNDAVRGLEAVHSTYDGQEAEWARRGGLRKRGARARGRFRGQRPNRSPRIPGPAAAARVRRSLSSSPRPCSAPIFRGLKKCCRVDTHTRKSERKWSIGLVVMTLDSESSSPSSILGLTFFLLLVFGVGRRGPSAAPLSAGIFAAGVRGAQRTTQRCRERVQFPFNAFLLLVPPPQQQRRLL